MYMTYQWLCDMMRMRKNVVLYKNGQTYTGLINGIMPESGSGKDWLVTLHSGGKNTNVYIRTA